MILILAIAISVSTMVTGGWVENGAANSGVVNHLVDKGANKPIGYRGGQVQRKHLKYRIDLQEPSNVLSNYRHHRKALQHNGCMSFT